jgi:WD40 repeat protein
MTRLPAPVLLALAATFAATLAAGPAQADGDALPEGALFRLGSRRLRHSGTVDCVTFSPDGKLLASAGSDGTVRLWDAATGQAVRTIDKHYYAAAFSPNGEWLAAADQDGTITLHNISTGKDTRRVGKHEGLVTVLAFTADGKRLAASGGYGRVTVWDVPAASRLHLLELHYNAWCSTLSFSPDGKRLAMADMGNRARVWDAATGEERSTFTAAGVVFSPDGKLLAASDLSGAVRLLDAATGKEVAKLPAGRSRYFVPVVFSPDGKLLAEGGDDGVRLFDVTKRQELHRAPAAPHGVPCLAFSPDGKALAWPAGYAVRARDVATWKERFAPDDPITEIAALAYSPDGKTLASGGTNDDRVLLWDVATGKQRRAFDCERQGVYCLAFAPDGKALAAGLTERTELQCAAVAVWDAVSGKRLHQLGRSRGGRGIAYSADGKLLASYDEGVSVWDAVTGKPHSAIPIRGSIHSVAFTDQGRRLLATTLALPLAEWDAATGKELRQFEGQSLPHLRMALFPSRRYVAVGWRYGSGTPQKNPIRVWEVATGQEVAALCRDESMADAVVVSPDGRLIACLRHDATIRVYDALTGDELRRFKDPSGPMAISFGPDGKTLASGGSDTTVTLWDVKDLAKKAARPEAPSAEQLAALWSDLDGGDGAKAYAAVRALARVPDQAVPLLRDRLTQPAKAGEPVEKLIARLDDDQYDVRERASAELEKLGAAAEAALRKALEGKPSPEAKRRIEALLAMRSVAGVTPERRTALRALEVLELAGTPEARRLIKSLAEGPAGAPLTVEARETLDRPGH